jgi:hypothetical protein
VTKVCTFCLVEQPLENFGSRGGAQKHLLKSRCKTCHFKAHKEWTQSNSERVREYRAKDPWTLAKRCKRHNLSVTEFWTIYEEQDGTCPICDEALKPEESAIDHNHQTGKVRGILCKTCNRGLGLLRDNPETLQRAVFYLKDKGYYG